MINQIKCLNVYTWSLGIWIQRKQIAMIKHLCVRHQQFNEISCAFLLLTYVARTTNTTYCNKLCMLSSCLGQCASSSSSKQQPSAAASTLRRRRRVAAATRARPLLYLLQVTQQPTCYNTITLLNLNWSLLYRLHNERKTQQILVCLHCCLNFKNSMPT